MNTSSSSYSIQADILNGEIWNPTEFVIEPKKLTFRYL